MRRLLIIVLLIVSRIEGDAKEPPFAGVGLEHFIERSEQVSLFSLDPTDPQLLPPEKKKPEIENFHGYVVLGRISHGSPQTNGRIRKALTASLAAYDGALCFAPRLGVRLISGGKQLDILLCFQCRQSAFCYDGDKVFSGLAPKAEAEFIAILDENGIARDIPKKEEKRASHPQRNALDLPQFAGDASAQHGPVFLKFGLFARRAWLI